MTMQGEIESPPVLWSPREDARHATEIGRCADWLERRTGQAFADYSGLACVMTALSQRAAPVTIRGSACRRASWFAVPLVVGRSVCAGDRKVAKALQPLEVAQALHQAG
jgi:hypothetical protein